MKPQIVATDKAPKAVGPYSQAVRAGEFLFCAGQIPLDPATGQLVPGGIQEQTARVLENIKAVLASQGIGLEHVVKTTVFMTNPRRLRGDERSLRKELSDQPARPLDRSGRRVAQRRAGGD